MPDHGITMVVTVENTGPMLDELIGWCTENGIKHHFIELKGHNQKQLDNEDVKIKLKKDLRNLFEQIAFGSQEKLYLHCVGGIHRTGICTYTLLRWSGMDRDQAMNAIKNMRNDTYIGVQEWRIQLADDALVPLEEQEERKEEDEV